MTKQALLNPTNDYVFGRIFGYKGNENITKGLIESITNEKYKSLKIASSVPTIKELQDDKMGILDIKATADNNSIFNIEMQVAKNQNIADRILWYWSNLYNNSINKGEDYIKTKKAIAILIADFDLSNLTKISKFHTSWHIREDEFSEIILTEKLELHIIELKKLEVNNNQSVKQKKLTKWLKFILNPDEKGDLKMEEDEDIKAARKVLEEISQDEKEREKARLRDKYVREMNSSRNEGYAEGKAEGISMGETSEKIKIAKIMLKEGSDISFIVKCTGLTEEEIKQIKNSNKTLL